MNKTIRLFCVSLALVFSALGANAAIQVDVNGDGEVNIADVNAVIDAILSNSATASCDVNGDDEVNIADVNALIDYILIGIQCIRAREKG